MLHPDDEPPPAYHPVEPAAYGPWWDYPDRLIELLESARYHFASKMPGLPHSYCFKREWRSGDEFQWAVAQLESRARRSWWGGPPRLYLDLNGYQYWDTSDPVHASLINRDWHRYGRSVPVYDRWANDYDWKLEDRKLDRDRAAHFFGAIPLSGRVLDIGCGTGQLVSHRYRELRPSAYRGIDPSAGLLSAFALNYERFAGCLVRSSFEHFWKPGERYDTIVALRGVCSYIRSDVLLPKVLRLLAPGGRALLTWYHEEDSMPFYRFAARPRA